MDELARTAGIQKARLYHHFPIKEALFVACVTEGYEAATLELASIRNDDRMGDAERIEAGIAALYRTIVSSLVGRMSPLIAEVATRMPEVAATFYEVFMRRQHDIFNGIIDRGLASGAFPHDRMGMEHLVFGSIRHPVALARDMAASGQRDAIFPVDAIRKGQTEMILCLLQPEARA
jgi:AcrR family transcriptional regulator